MPIHGRNLAATMLALSLGTGITASTMTACFLGTDVHAQSAFDDRVRLLEMTASVFESVADAAAPAVVYIESQHVDDTGEVNSEDSGSGVLIRPAQLDHPIVLTNLHVVEGALLDDISITLADGRVITPTDVWADPETDLAFLDLDEPNLPAARLGRSDDLHIGQWVIAIGSPFGLSQSVTHGIISAKQRRQLGIPGNLRMREFIQTDAAINPGNSGGPLLNLRGEVIGVNTAIASESGSSSGVAFSIPADIVHWVMGELLAHGKVRRGFLGVEFPNGFDFRDARRLGLSVARGAAVHRVHPKTPAARAGLKPKDVILEFDGQVVDSDAHLINIVSQTPIGKKVEVKVWRKRREVRLHAVLGDWEQFQVSQRVEEL
ncbi:Periplasmic serine endoprotease DegP precursor [Planctomycetes bacterium Pan216]|uniref:Periplasmic serine endoprotease DegP n=1 Tax=Kolteria novifilia TaxID=2527975 RepID=A0A518AYT3_9BACT|nr:Periplasmic serine endoprotease DegP precursor [Planctomycetes bacterium Pan216]